MTEPSGTRWNSDAGCPPSRGRAGRIRIGALAAALLPLLLRPASEARGETNLTLDDFVNKLDPATRAAGEKAAQPWVTAVQEPKG